MKKTELSFRLTPREAEAIMLMAQGHIQKVTAHKMQISATTVERMLGAARTRNACKTNVQMALLAYKHGLIK
jgi:DNA-binding CsgD family transcriptional regulator